MTIYIHDLSSYFHNLQPPQVIYYQLIITASAITTSPPGDSLYSRHRVVSPATPQSPAAACSRLQFLHRAPHRVERRFASASFSCSFLFISSTSAWFFNLFIHRSVASSKRLQADTHPRFEPSAPPSLVACLRPPFYSSSRVLLLAPYMSLQLVVCGNFSHAFLITLFIGIRTFHTDTGTLIYSLLSCEFLYCTRLHIYHSDLHRIYYMSHVFSGMLTHLCLVTCPKVMITLLCP